MPILVNGQLVAEALINEEFQRLAGARVWAQIPDEIERSDRMRGAAEMAATDRILISQSAALDSRPVDSAELEQQIEKMRPHFPAGLGEDTIRQSLERHLRIRRFREELVSEAPKPTEEEIELFYYNNRENFRMPELLTAAHIVKHLRDPEDYDPALHIMNLALEELEAGAEFEAGFGTIFSLTPPAAAGGAWTKATIYDLPGGADGEFPIGVTIGKGGVLFGTTVQGGTNNIGTIYSLAPPSVAGGTWTHTVLHSFSGSDGAYPVASLIKGVGGVLYGTTKNGGNDACLNGCGTVFSLQQ